MTLDQSKLKYDAHGLIPAVIQDIDTKDVLMMAYMNEEALKRTIESRQTWFWSRSRQEYWHKGATSGHFQDVVEISYDCDADCLLIKVKQTGAACHTGRRSCFFNRLVDGPADDSSRETGDAADMASPAILDEIHRVIMDRKETMPEGSYTTYLFTKGLDKILKKVGEESAEVIIGAKNRSRDELVYETGDLLYHLMVLLVNEGVSPREVYAELAKRRK